MTSIASIFLNIFYFRWPKGLRTDIGSLKSSECMYFELAKKFFLVSARRKTRTVDFIVRVFYFFHIKSENTAVKFKLFLFALVCYTYMR